MEPADVDTPVTEGAILVAADGSAGARRALDWAVAEAALRHCAIALVSVYDASGPDVDQRRKVAEQAIADTMDGLADRADRANRANSPVITSHVVHGEPAEVLIRESAQSQLLVMGSHGVSTMMHSALGSVTDLCARMADCPVVVLPPTSRRALPGDKGGERMASGG